MFCLRQSICRDQREVYGFSRASLLHEHLAFPPERFIAFRIDGEHPFAELHFAEIDHSVVAVDNQIYLDAPSRAVRRASPGTCVADHAGNPQSLLDGVNVLKTEPFKCQSRPSIVDRGGEWNLRGLSPLKSIALAIKYCEPQRT